MHKLMKWNIPIKVNKHMGLGADSTKQKFSVSQTGS